MAPLPFNLSAVLRPLSPPVATTRLKSNAFALFLFLLRTAFPPYNAFRAGVIAGCDMLQGRGGIAKSAGEIGVGLAEALCFVVLVWNIVEAIVALQYPSTYVPPVRKTMALTPVKVSSPLTRPYSPARPVSREVYSVSPASFQSAQTPLRQAAQAAQTQTPGLTASTSSQLSSSVSSSTAKILNLGLAESPGRGLFYQRNGEMAPGVGGEFVLVDRDEKEWVDNVWKGVRGKGGRVAY